jgi:hypothetical protein
MCLWISYMKKYETNNFFVTFKVTEERSRIRIRTKMSRIRNTAENTVRF